MANENGKEINLGRYIIADPNVCHGKPTFVGTRVFVEDVLEQVASGMAWQTIIEDWHESISKDAISEAVQLASLAWSKYWEELALK